MSERDELGINPWELCEDYRALRRVQACDREVQEAFAHEIVAMWNSRSPWSHYSSLWFLEYRSGDYAKVLKKIGLIDKGGCPLLKDGTIKIILRWLFFWKFWGKR